MQQMQGCSTTAAPGPVPSVIAAGAVSDDAKMPATHPRAGHTPHSFIAALVEHGQVTDTNTHHERQLWANVFLSAIWDGFPERRETNEPGFTRARQWFSAPGTGPGSFRWVCAALLPTLPWREVVMIVGRIWAMPEQNFLRRTHPDWNGGRRGY